MGIDKKELSKVLLSLDAMYSEHSAAGVPVDTEAEFRSYMVLAKVCADFFLLFSPSVANAVCARFLSSYLVSCFCRVP
jgi:hypothetical protein